jgi:2'-5' RNA ligase
MPTSVWVLIVIIDACDMRAETREPVRLFVAAWPPEEVIGTIAGAILGRTALGPRWVDMSKWHVTLAFLGSVPDDDLGDLIEAVARTAATSPPCSAELGPSTTTLGRSVLCVPVEGLADLARVVRHATASFNHSSDRDRSFTGHLTLARAPRRVSIPPTLQGIAVWARWPVEEIALVSSKTLPDGARYSTVAKVRLEG